MQVLDLEERAIVAFSHSRYNLSAVYEFPVVFLNCSWQYSNIISVSLSPPNSLFPESAKASKTTSSTCNSNI